MERREKIIEAIRASEKPLSASALAAMFHVSRQIIVGDVALLRARGIDIVATPRGYMLEEKAHPLEKKIAVVHGRAQLQEELYTIVDYGCTAVDVIVEHPIYGSWWDSCTCLPAMMSIVSESIRASEPLSQLTHGVHLHTIRYPDENAFAQMKEALREKGILYPHQSM